MAIKGVLVKPTIQPQEFRLMAVITVTIFWNATTGRNLGTIQRNMLLPSSGYVLYSSLLKLLL
jgi:hypothetical protein